jgi:hypothetical protein
MSEAVLRKRVAEVKECCICFDELSDYKNRVVTSCSHVFCTTCLLIHFREKNECPMCREKLLPRSSACSGSFDISTNRRRVTQLATDIRGTFRTRQEYIDSIVSTIIAMDVYTRFYNYVDNIAPSRIHIRQRSRGTRRCGICRQTGHDRRGCPNR